MTRMNCSEISELLTAHHDGELPQMERRAVDEHLARCAACRADLAALAATSARVRAAGTFAVPPDFVLPELADPGLRGRAYRHLGLLASHAAAAAVGALLVIAALNLPVTGDRLVREAVDVHTRAITAGSEVQVASADTHTVRPWLSSRVAFSPPVHNELPGGAKLIGGRTDTLAGRQTAVLVYELRRHRVAIFVQPREASALPPSIDATRNGFNLVGWQSGDFAYLALSDVNGAELRSVAASLRQ